MGYGCTSTDTKTKGSRPAVSPEPTASLMYRRAVTYTRDFVTWSNIIIKYSIIKKKKNQQLSVDSPRTIQLPARQNYISQNFHLPQNHLIPIPFHATYPNKRYPHQYRSGISQNYAGQISAEPNESRIHPLSHALPRRVEPTTEREKKSDETNDRSRERNESMQARAPQLFITHFTRNYKPLPRYRRGTLCTEAAAAQRPVHPR